MSLPGPSPVLSIAALAGPLVAGRGLAVRSRPALRVAIVHGEPGARHTVASLFDDPHRFTRAGRYPTLEQARRGLPSLPADVLLVDATGPRWAETHAIGGVRSASPTTALVAIVDDPRQARVFDLICSGVTGCLLTPLAPARLATAVEDAADGGSPLSPEIARTVVDVFQRTGLSDVQTTALTGQEIRLLSRLASGSTYQTAGEELGVSVNTVRNYVRSIYEKLRVHSKGEAVAKAFRRGLI